MRRETTFETAVRWLHSNLILCNNIVETDPSILDNIRFDIEDEYGNVKEIFQYYLTDCSEEDVEFLEKSFTHMNFSYSEKLDLYVLCVDHFGTAWDYVPVYCINDSIKLKEAQ